MKSYLTFLSRNKVYAAIEAFGLATALGFIILLVSYATTEFSVGRNIKDADKIYILGTGDMFGLTLDTPVEFFHQFPEIKSWTRMANCMEQDVTVEDKYLKANSAYIDSTFFQLFDYRLSGCSREQVLTNADEVIVSESFARKAFGTDEAVGKKLKIGERFFTVCGIMQDFGRKDLFQQTDLFFCIKLAYDVYQRMDNFGNTQTFLTLEPDTDSEVLAKKLLKKYVEYWPEFYDEDGGKGALIWGSTLTRLTEAYFSPLEGYGILKKGNQKLVVILLLVAFVLLISACFNYVNLTVALTGKRAKEMTMRRLLGESRHRIVLRYFTEALLFTTGSFVLGYFVAYLFKPFLEEWFSTTIPLVPDIQMLTVSIGILLVISLVSSIIPAALVLQFKPIDVMKGTFRFKNKMIFSKVFIVIQNIISMTLIALSLTMTIQMHHLLTLPTGYQTDGLVLVDSWDIGYTVEKQEILRQHLLALPQVETVGRAGSLPFRSSSNGIRDAQGNKSWIYYSCMDMTAFRLFGFKVIEQYGNPTDSLCYVDYNAKTHYQVTMAHPSIDGSYEESTGVVVTRPQYRVCGIVENYRNGMANHTPRFTSSNNVIQLLGPNDRSWSLIVKVKGDSSEALVAVKNTCREVAQQVTGYPKELNCTYIADILEDALSQERHTMYLVLCFMSLSILISALGLFAISLNYCEQRSKEIAIRKIMGASDKEMVWSLTRRFVLLSLVSVVIAIPLCIKAMRFYLQDFYYQVDFPWLIIPLAACITVLVISLSVIGQAQRISTDNPINSIKTE